MQISATKQRKSAEQALAIVRDERLGLLDKLYYKMYKRKELTPCGQRLVYYPFYVIQAGMRRAGAPADRTQAAFLLVDAFLATPIRMNGFPCAEAVECPEDAVVAAAVDVSTLTPVVQAFLGRQFLRKYRGAPVAAIRSFETVYKPMLLLSYAEKDGKRVYKCVDAESGQRAYWLEPHVDRLYTEDQNTLVAAN